VKQHKRSDAQPVPLIVGISGLRGVLYLGKQYQF